MDVISIDEALTDGIPKINVQNKNAFDFLKLLSLKVVAFYLFVVF